MVRVNHPPGGKMKLNAEATPDSRTVRVLKPPGGGSSIVFEEDDNMKPVKSRPQQQEQSSPPPQAAPDLPKEAPQSEKQPEQPFPKPETNGMSTPDCSKEDAASTRDSNPSPAATTNGQPSPALNGPPAVNGSSSTNGSVSSGTSSSMSVHSGGTPKHLNTQTRIFGNEQGAPTPRRRLRDHERSNIFSGDEATPNGTPRPADVNGSSRSSESTSTPEPKTPEQLQQQPSRQRVPPGGFSTKLW